MLHKNEKISKKNLCVPLVSSAISCPFWEAKGKRDEIRKRKRGREKWKCMDGWREIMVEGWRIKEEEEEGEPRRELSDERKTGGDKDTEE